MELEIVRASADAVADVTIGLAAQINGLVMDKVGDLKPVLRAIYNYVDDPFVARRTFNADEIAAGGIQCPFLAVYLEGEPAIDPWVRTVYRDGDVAIAFSYVSNEQNDAKRMRDGLYTNRALLRFLTQFNLDANDTMRQRNGIHFWIGTAPIRQFTPMESWEAGILAAQTIVTYRARETSP